MIFFLLNIDCSYSQKFSYKGDCVYHPDFDCTDNCLSDCIDKELNDFNLKLNSLYKELHAKDSHSKLKKAEQLWIKFKEADCDYMASEVNGGKLYGDIYKACLINRIKERIRDLKRSYLFFGWFRGQIN
ncbi:MAG: lysozyme inhibitor LprI family protein [Erysipelotrichaceae bacterium]